MRPQSMHRLWILALLITTPLKNTKTEGHSSNLNNFKSLLTQTIVCLSCLHDYVNNHTWADNAEDKGLGCGQWGTSDLFE